MTLSRRIETSEARELRGRRQIFAAPGGSHDKLVQFLVRALPMGIGIIVALMVITPLAPRGEISFLLDRNRVAMIDQRLSVENAMYRGQDDKGRPFSVATGEAVQRSSREGIVRMKELSAQLSMPEGPARVWAKSGSYLIDAEQLQIPDTVRFEAADGYWMIVRNVTVNLASRRLIGSGGVEGRVPMGSFSAERIEGDLDKRILVLYGKARMTMVPGKLRSFK